MNGGGGGKQAFTLAEVLITLGIIGIVAAMTLPTLITNYQKKQTATHLKKFYSTMQQAIKLSELQNGEVKYWDFEIGGNNNMEVFTNTYLKPYLKIIKEYQPDNFPADIHYKCLNGNNCDAYGEVKNNNPKIVLADGTMILATDLIGAYDVDNKLVAAVNIIVDINGFKKPNQYGRDVFAFTIQHHTGFAPAGVGFVNELQGSQGFDRDWFKNAGGNVRACNINQNGFFCAGLIMVDGWEIKDDYPW